jgi:hypothetical protein
MTGSRSSPRAEPRFAWDVEDRARFHASLGRGAEACGVPRRAALAVGGRSVNAPGGLTPSPTACSQRSPMCPVGGRAHFGKHRPPAQGQRNRGHGRGVAAGQGRAARPRDPAPGRAAPRRGPIASTPSRLRGGRAASAHAVRALRNCAPAERPRRFRAQAAAGAARHAGVVRPVRSPGGGRESRQLSIAPGAAPSCRRSSRSANSHESHG